MATKTRLYRVLNNTTQQVRLIEAATPQAARAHASSTEYAVCIPEQRDIFNLAQAGVQIEVAGGGDPSDQTRADAAQANIPE